MGGGELPGVVVVGNIVVDFVAKPDKDLPKWGQLCSIDNPISPNIGGNGAISSVFLSKLGIKTTLVGKIGKDFLGDWIFKELKKKRLPISNVKVSRGTTSATISLVNKDGRRSFLHHIGVNANLSSSDVPSNFSGADWFHLCSYFLLPKIGSKAAANMLKKAQEKGLWTSLDLAWDPTNRWDLGSVLKHVDILFLNQDEGERVTGSAAPIDMVEMLRSAGPTFVVLKMAGAGCAVMNARGESFFAPSFDVKVLDTTGAGDAFNAGFIYSFRKLTGGKRKRKKSKAKKARKVSDPLDKYDMGKMKKVALVANALGAMSTTQLGGTTTAPTPNKLLQFVKSQKKKMNF
jgi:sugar/nucleoside kinase (ribokinase family)